MPRRAIGISGFDLVAQDYEGAIQLSQTINQDPARFQAARSLYIQVSSDKFDDADDDQWAMALEAIRPGNMKHNLKVVKIVVIGAKLFDPYSKTTLSSSNQGNPYIQAQTALANSKRPFRRIPMASACFFTERAFVKALSNIRGVAKVEIAGPVEATLKRMLAVAMTTRPGHKVRDWSYGGGLRSEDDISWGSWSATMQPTDKAEQPAARAHELSRFDLQFFLPQQPMQIITDASLEPNRVPLLPTVGAFEEMARPRLPLDGGPSHSTFDSASSGAGGLSVRCGFGTPADSRLSEAGSGMGHKQKKDSKKRKKGSAGSRNTASAGHIKRGYNLSHGDAEGDQSGYGDGSGRPPQSVGSHGDRNGGTEAGHVQDADVADDGGQLDPDVEMMDCDEEEEYIPSEDGNDDDYED